MFRLTPLQVSDDLRNENCIIVDGFYVYRDKIVQFTRHFGYTVNIKEHMTKDEVIS